MPHSVLVGGAGLLCPETRVSMPMVAWRTDRATLLTPRFATPHRQERSSSCSAFIVLTLRHEGTMRVTGFFHSADVTPSSGHSAVPCRMTRTVYSMPGDDARTILVLHKTIIYASNIVPIIMNVQRGNRRLAACGHEQVLQDGYDCIPLRMPSGFSVLHEYLHAFATQ